MSIINTGISNSANSLTNSGAATANAANTNATSQVDSDKNKQSKTPRLDSSEIVVSSRAQKLQALSAEFFAGDGITNTNIDALKQRAYEYGLISEVKFKQLTSGAANPNQRFEETKQNTQSLADELNKIEKELAKRNQEVPEEERQDVSPILKTLSDAAKILKDPETAITEEQFKQNIAKTLKELNDIIESDTFSNLPINERVGITNATKGLSIVESIAPRTSNNSRINQYIANSFR